MTITKEGALASFYTVNKAPIKHLRVYFSPKQAGSGDPSPENIRPIEGWNEINLYQGREDLVQFAVATTAWVIPSNLLGKQVIYCAYIDNTNGTQEAKLSLRFISQDNVVLTTGYSKQKLQVGQRGYICCIVPLFENAYILQLSVNGLQSPSMVSERHLYLYGNNIYTQFDTTIYGGYVDLITGELVETHNCITLDGTAPFNNIVVMNSDTNLLRLRMYLNEITNKTIKPISNLNFAIFNYLKSVQEITLAWNGYFTGGSTNPRLAVYVQDDNITSIDSFLDYLNIHPLQVCYELETPIIHQLTPTQLSTLIGQNHIWSNADHIEVEYDLAESNDELYRRRNILLQNAPHLKTIQSGNTEDSTIIAHFTASGEPLTKLTLTLPYNSEGYQSATITAAGVNLIGQDMTNGLSYGVYFTRHFNSDGLLEYVTAEGTTTSTNTFRNYNYVKNEQRWILGRTATCCYSDAGYFPMVANNDSPRTIEGWVTGRVTEDGWRRYDVYGYTSTQSSAWHRFQIISPVTGTEVSTKLYPLVCLAQDMYCDYDPYRGVDYTITLPETFYGGEVDLITGHGISEYAADGTRLSSPNTFSVTPQSVNTLLGINNIWSNQGLVTVKYWTH